MKRLAFVLVTAYFLLITSSLAVSSNKRINYQGRLIDGTNLVNGIVTNVFRLYNAGSGGTLYYEQTQVVTVVDGLYSTTIGSDVITPSLESVVVNPVV